MLTPFWPKLNSFCAHHQAKLYRGLAALGTKLWWAQKLFNFRQKGVNILNVSIIMPVSGVRPLAGSPVYKTVPGAGSPWNTGAFRLWPLHFIHISTSLPSAPWSGWRLCLAWSVRAPCPSGIIRWLCDQLSTGNLSQFSRQLQHYGVHRTQFQLLPPLNQILHPNPFFGSFHSRLPARLDTQFTNNSNHYIH